MTWDKILKIKIRNLSDIKRLGKEYAVEDMYEGMIISEEEYESLNTKEKQKYHSAFETLIRRYDDKKALSQELAFHVKMKGRILQNSKLPTYNKIDNTRYTDELKTKVENQERKRKEREERRQKREEGRERREKLLQGRLERRKRREERRKREQELKRPESPINQIIVDYFKIYNNMYGRNPTLAEIEEEEERPLTVDEIESFKVYNERFIRKSWINILKARDIKIPKKRKQGKVDTSKYYTTRFKQSEPVRRSANLKRLKELQNTGSKLESQIEYIRRRLEFFNTPFLQLSEDDREEFEDSFKYEKEEYPDAKNPEDVYNQEKKTLQEDMIEFATNYGKVVAEMKKLKEELGE
tara:strand:- start:53 stop:1114 length:1062 start_codon:yes stop_codon:yes gene_type:complete